VQDIQSPPDFLSKYHRFAADVTFVSRGSSLRTHRRGSISAQAVKDVLHLKETPAFSV
jgi:hypothetical protein